MIKGLPGKLRDLREKYGFSQKQVAAKLGVSPSVVSAYETGERTPSTEVLLSLSYLYSCTTDFLLGKQVPSPASAIDTTGLADEQIAALAKLVETMRRK